jgi:hypothetical protein
VLFERWSSRGRFVSSIPAKGKNNLEGEIVTILFGERECIVAHINGLLA